MVDYDAHYEDCIPETPDVQGAIDKAKQTAKGKLAKLDFRPVDFTIDVSKFLSFEMIFKILGKPEGLGYDMCAITVDGDLDAAIAGSPFPDGGDAYVEATQDAIDAAQNAADGAAADISGLTSDINSIQGDVTSIQGDVTDLEDRLDNAGIP